MPNAQPNRELLFYQVTRLFDQMFLHNVAVVVIHSLQLNFYILLCRYTHESQQVVQFDCREK